MSHDRTGRDSKHSHASLRFFVEKFIESPPLAERLTTVLMFLPDEILDDLLGDPCFQIAMDNYVVGRGSRVWMALPENHRGAWRGSRSVVLKPRLIDCAAEFAHYVIAHELAHAYLWNGGWGEIIDREEAADALAASWGFLRPLSL